MSCNHQYLENGGDVPMVHDVVDGDVGIPMDEARGEVVSLHPHTQQPPPHNKPTEPPQHPRIWNNGDGY